MIDIHTHLLPAVDDGASSLRESLRMARIAYESGTDYLVLTPHCLAPGMQENLLPSLYPRFLSFRDALREAGIPLHIGFGAEVYYTSRLHELLTNGQLMPLAGTKYVLIEFPYEVNVELLDRAMDDFADTGYAPVLAHPERYEFCGSSLLPLINWKKRGGLIQVNKDSLLGNFGADIAAMVSKMIRRGLVDCIASDAHHEQTRTPSLDTVYAHLSTVYGEETARSLLERNPRAILSQRGSATFFRKPYTPTEFEDE